MDEGADERAAMLASLGYLQRVGVLCSKQLTSPSRNRGESLDAPDVLDHDILEAF